MVSFHVVGKILWTSPSLVCIYTNIRVHNSGGRWPESEQQSVNTTWRSLAPLPHFPSSPTNSRLERIWKYSEQEPDQYREFPVRHSCFKSRSWGKVSYSKDLASQTSFNKSSSTFKTCLRTHQMLVWAYFYGSLKKKKVLSLFFYCDSNSFSNPLSLRSQKWTNFYFPLSFYWKLHFWWLCSLHQRLLNIVHTSFFF